MTNAPPTEKPSKAKQKLFTVGRYVLCYLAGIVSCVLFTPVEMGLIDTSIGLLFVPLAPIGYFFFYFDLEPQYVLGSSISYWSVYVLGLALVSLGSASVVLMKDRFRMWRPLMIGFPIGFVGTLGVYYTAASSV